MTHSAYLRCWRADDATALFELYQLNADLHRQIPTLNTSADAEKFVQSGYLPSPEHAVFCIEIAGNVAGCVSVQFTARDDAGAWDRGWVSYWSAPTMRGRGLMKQAVKTVCDWALGEYAHGYGSLQLGMSLLDELDSPRLRRLELGYRSNNPASGKVAAAAGFTVEGVEREKFLYNERTYDAVNAARLRSGARTTSAETQDSASVAAPVMVHHMELWTADFAGKVVGWSQLMGALGAVVSGSWQNGISWEGADGSYIVLEQSPDVSGALYRTHAGMNHLALNVSNRKHLDKIRAEAPSWGWHELFAIKYPHAGGAKHTALYLENPEGFEVELVVR